MACPVAATTAMIYGSKWFGIPVGRMAGLRSVNTNEVPNGMPITGAQTAARTSVDGRSCGIQPADKWAIAITSVIRTLGVSSMKLHRYLNIRQATAWHMLHRIRKAMQGGDPLFNGPVEVDESTSAGQ